MLHFAYGSNMHRAVMRTHAPHAEPVGAAALADFRFVITADGYASVAPKRGATVHGVLWRLTSRDRVTLDAWEGIAMFFEPGREILVARNGPEVAEQLARLDAAEARRIGEAARARALAEHTYAQRVRLVEDTLAGRLG